MTHRLCVLFPPGSVEREITRVQQGLFQRWGLVSALALPPLIPLLFLPRDLKIADPKRLRATIGLKIYCRTGAPAIREGYLFWEVHHAGQLDRLREALLNLFLSGKREAAQGALAGWEGQGLFPEGSGFLLAGPELREGLQAVMAALEASPGSLPAIQFPLARLSIINLESPTPDPATAGGRQGWWEQLQWQEIVSVPFSSKAANFDPPPGAVDGSLDPP